MYPTELRFCTTRKLSKTRKLLVFKVVRSDHAGFRGGQTVNDLANEDAELSALESFFRAENFCHKASGWDGFGHSFLVRSLALGVAQIRHATCEFFGDRVHRLG